MITIGIDPSRKSFCASFTENMIEFDYQEYENSPRGFEKVLKKSALFLRILKRSLKSQKLYKKSQVFLSLKNFNGFKILP